MKIFWLFFQLESRRYLFNLTAFEKNDLKRVLKYVEKKMIALPLSIDRHRHLSNVQSKTMTDIP
jgi:hypothetical protein